MTSHPKDVSPRLIEAMATLEPVCEHLHLPAQSGSDATLAAMRRGYDVHTYLDLVARLRAAIPGLALTTDLIVGFPGETDEDFQATLDLVDEVGFDAAFTFQYSPRPQTKAADLPARVPPDVLESRMRRLVDLTQAWGRTRNEALVGSTVEVLVEGRSRRDAESVMGRTRSHKTVNFRSDALVGDLVWATIESASSTSLQGVAAGDGLSRPPRDVSPLPRPDRRLRCPPYRPRPSDGAPGGRRRPTGRRRPPRGRGRGSDRGRPKPKVSSSPSSAPPEWARPRWPPCWPWSWESG